MFRPKEVPMIRKFVFGILAAVFLAAGGLVAAVDTGYAGPGLIVGGPAATPVVPANPDLLLVKQCGPWNNWCGSGGGGSACFNFGGIQLCTGGTGSHCEWHNGKKYCSGGGGGGGDWCIWHHGDKYCRNRDGGDCIWRNGHQYCTGW